MVEYVFKYTKCLDGGINETTCILDLDVEYGDDAPNTPTQSLSIERSYII